MPLFTRRTPAPVRLNYRSYKHFLRKDFAYKCVFCNIHENDNGGYWSFHVEHLRPKANPRFASLVLDYNNLLYCCNRCNALKGDTWFSDDPVKDGKGWADPCLEDFATHYEFSLSSDKLILTTYSKLGRWITTFLALDHALRLSYLELFHIMDKGYKELVHECESELADLYQERQAHPSVKLNEKIDKWENRLKKTKAIIQARNKPAVYKKLRRGRP